MYIYIYTGETVACDGIFLEKLNREGAGGGGTVFSGVRVKKYGVDDSLLPKVTVMVEKYKYISVYLHDHLCIHILRLYRSYYYHSSITHLLYIHKYILYISHICYTMYLQSVLKVSWETSSKSVKHECEVLKYLEKYNVQGIEKCLAVCRYNPPILSDTNTIASTSTSKATATVKSKERDTQKETDYFREEKENSDNIIDNNEKLKAIKKQPDISFFTKLYKEDEIEKEILMEKAKEREMIVLEPFFTPFQPKNPCQSSLENVVKKDKKIIAVRNIMQTMMDMLSAGAAGSDIQLLIDVDTGKKV